MSRLSNRMRGGPGRRQILFPLALSLPATPPYHSGGPAQAALSLEGYPGLHRDGLNDDSPAVAAALSDAMRNHQALYVPSGGPILLAGGARLPRLDDVALIGDGVQDGGPPPYGRRGSTFWIIDDTEPPFRLGRNWMVSKLNFFWPRQMERGQEPILYPPLFSNASGQPVTTGVLEQLRVINAFDFFVADGPGPSETVGDVLIQGCRIYAVRDCFRLRSTPEVIQVSDFLFSYEPFGFEVGQYGKKTPSYSLREFTTSRGCFLHVVGDGTPGSASRTTAGLFTCNVFIYGYGRGVWADRGAIFARLAETSFDGVATVTVC